VIGADRILVLGRRVVDSGRHVDLIRREGPPGA
jgi:ABC-type transport system involved in Fe-S cluster assembly fused permease/ATPase subunit